MKWDYRVINHMDESIVLESNDYEVAKEYAKEQYGYMDPSVQFNDNGVWKEKADYSKSSSIIEHFVQYNEFIFYTYVSGWQDALELLKQKLDAVSLPYNVTENDWGHPWVYGTLQENSFQEEEEKRKQMLLA